MVVANRVKEESNKADITTTISKEDVRSEHCQTKIKMDSEWFNVKRFKNLLNYFSSDRAKSFENFGGGPKNYRNNRAGGGRSGNLNNVKNESSATAATTTTKNNDDGGWGQSNGWGDSKNETEGLRID